MEGIHTESNGSMEGASWICEGGIEVQEGSVREFWEDWLTATEEPFLPTPPSDILYNKFNMVRTAPPRHPNTATIFKGKLMIGTYGLGIFRDLDVFGIFKDDFHGFFG